MLDLVETLLSTESDQARQVMIMKVSGSDRIRSGLITSSVGSIEASMYFSKKRYTLFKSCNSRLIRLCVTLWLFVISQSFLPLRLGFKERVWCSDSRLEG